MELQDVDIRGTPAELREPFAVGSFAARRTTALGSRCLQLTFAERIKLEAMPLDERVSQYAGRIQTWHDQVFASHRCNRSCTTLILPDLVGVQDDVVIAVAACPRGALCAYVQFAYGKSASAVASEDRFTLDMTKEAARHLGNSF